MPVEPPGVSGVAFQYFAAVTIFLLHFDVKVLIK